MSRQLRIGLGLVALGTAGLFVGTNGWMRASAAARIFRGVEDVPVRYVAIVLGAKVWEGGQPSHVLEDRLITAEALLRAGKVQRLLVSGDHGQPEYDEVNAMRDWLLAHHVPREKIFLDHAGFRTHDSMIRAAQIFEVKDAVVVTQDFHLPRALFLARNVGIDAVGVTADRRRYVGEHWNTVRETLARVNALLDVKIRGKSAKFLGAPHPIHGDAAVTWDRDTTANPR